MLKFLRIPFATSGDRAAVPDATDPSGFVSWTQGYGPDYQRDLSSDPLAKPIERDKMNDVLFSVSTAVAELQSQGVPDFITTALNGGSAYSYSAMALCRYSGDLYLSLVGANTALPSDATKWALLPTPGRIQSDSYASAVGGGTVDAITATFQPAFTTNAGAYVIVRLTGANTLTAPTLKLDALTAKTIVKANNLPLVSGDLPGAGAWAIFKHDVTLDKFVLLNPAATGRRIGQVVTFQSGASASGTTQIPTDTTIPQQTEGDQYMSASITPINAASTLEIEVLLFGQVSVSSSASVAIFKDSDANALSAAALTMPSAGGGIFTIPVNHVMAAGGTSAITFKVRAGINQAGTFFFNGLFGGVASSRIAITEILP